MEIWQREMAGGILRVTLAGSFDIGGAGEVGPPLSEIAGTWDRVLVDMSGVDFLTSVGLRLLIRSAITIDRRGGRMVLAQPNEAVRKVLASTGIDQFLMVVDDEEAGRAAFG